MWTLGSMLGTAPAASILSVAEKSAKAPRSEKFRPFPTNGFCLISPTGFASSQPTVWAVTEAIATNTIGVSEKNSLQPIVGSPLGEPPRNSRLWVLALISTQDEDFWEPESIQMLKFSVKN